MRCPAPNWIAVAIGVGALLGSRLPERAVKVFAAAAFVLFGDDRGGELRSTQELVRTLGIEGNVHFAGYRRPIEPWLTALDLLLAPGVGDAFGRTLVEAMLAGVVERVRGSVDRSLGSRTFGGQARVDADRGHLQLDFGVESQSLRLPGERTKAELETDRSGTRVVPSSRNSTMRPATVSMGASIVASGVNGVAFSKSLYTSAQLLVP